MSTAVLLSCHGTVEKLEDVPAFLNNIRRGRPTPQALIEEVQHRLAKIGGSPLMKITSEQAASLEKRLGIRCVPAGRLWHPYPKDVIQKLIEEGVTTLISLPLAPQSVHIYNDTVREAAAAHPNLKVAYAKPWGMEPALIEAFIETIDETLEKVIPDERTRIPIILSAHSLPLRVIAAGDPYETQFREMANAVAAHYNKKGHTTTIAFQSQGASAEPWLGPDLQETFTQLHKNGATKALIAPIGFLAEHVETLYDLDIDAPKQAEKAGLTHLLRAPAVCARPKLIDALETTARHCMA